MDFESRADNLLYTRIKLYPEPLGIQVPENQPGEYTGDSTVLKVIYVVLKRSWGDRCFIIKKIRSFTDRILEFSLESVLKDERSSGSLGLGFREES